MARIGLSRARGNTVSFSSGPPFMVTRLEQKEPWIPDNTGSPITNVGDKRREWQIGVVSPWFCQRIPERRRHVIRKREEDTFADLEDQWQPVTTNNAWPTRDLNSKKMASRTSVDALSMERRICPSLTFGIIFYFFTFLSKCYFCKVCDKLYNV